MSLTLVREKLKTLLIERIGAFAMDLILTDIRNVAESIFLGGDMIFLAMVIGAVLVGVFSMRSFGQILCTSVLALVVLAIIWIIYGGATSAAPTDPATWIGQLEAGWATMGGISGSTMVGYLVTFAAAIGVLSLVRSLLFRG